MRKRDFERTQRELSRQYYNDRRKQEARLQLIAFVCIWGFIIFCILTVL